MRRNSFLTFLAALIPGIGYMYLGLIRRGIQFLLLYLLIEPVFRIVGLSFLASIIKIPLWFYTFFDTFNVANKLDRGEIVYDSDIFGNGSFQVDGRWANLLNDKWILIAGWALVILGVLGVINKAFYGNEIYNLIRSYISTYFIPVIFIAIGAYLLYKNNR